MVRYHHTHMQGVNAHSTTYVQRHTSINVNIRRHLLCPLRERTLPKIHQQMHNNCAALCGFSLSLDIFNLLAHKTTRIDSCCNHYPPRHMHTHLKTQLLFTKTHIWIYLLLTSMTCSLLVQYVCISLDIHWLFENNLMLLI